ncbi:hypothetical protein [Prauserella muralis]|uniref:hypothetical protein n=1 Tax=Prauserella muralis TaxID=588067 RepID=UPI000DD4808C|nr:hypothetical protein [Prauserella muralis]
MRALRRMRDLIASGVLPSDAALTLASGRQDAPSELVAEVVAAARALDSGRCCAVLGRSVAEHGVVWTWDRLRRPALRTVDADQRTDPDRVDIEHALSWSVSVALHRAPRGGEAGPPSVLLACTEPELHALPLEALAAALAERGCPARMLGAATPARGLVRAVAATRAESVVLWSQTAATAEDAALRELGSARARRITAGPGWPGGPRQGDAHVTSLGGALELLTGQR